MLRQVALAVALGGVGLVATACSSSPQPKSAPVSATGHDQVACQTYGVVHSDKDTTGTIPGSAIENMLNALAAASGKLRSDGTTMRAAASQAAVSKALDNVGTTCNRLFPHGVLPPDTAPGSTIPLDVSPTTSGPIKP